MPDLRVVVNNRSTRRPRPLLLGHRGDRKHAPENSLAAFELALEHGCDGFEFDLRSTADHRLIVCHDPVLAGVEIAATLYEGIRPKHGATSPCLEDVLERYAHRSFLDIELKVAGMERAVVALLRERPPQREFVVSSFLAEVVRNIRWRDPAIPAGFICDKSRELARWPALPVDVVIPKRSLVDRKLVEEIHAAGRKVFVWTVNQPSEMLRLAEWGVDALISDDTQLLARAFSGRKPRA